MGFGSKLKRAFGISPEEDESEYEDNAGAQDGQYEPAAANAAAPELRSRAAAEHDGEIAAEDPELASRIFGQVVEIFNKSLPDFLRETVDTKAQREYLYKALDSGVREYLADVNVRAHRHSDAQWQQRQTSLRAEVETYKEKLRLLEEKQNEARQAQLSAERQKRALSERVHDLESKILKFEADAEQYDLEKKSLMNKLKVASVHDGDNEALRDELEQLRLQLTEARKQNQELSKAAEEANVTPEVQVQTVENPETERLLQEALAENARLKTDSARVRKEHEKEVADAYETSKELEAQLHISRKNAAELRSELEHANSELKAAESIKETIVKFEDVKRRLDERIAALRDENERLQKACQDHENMIAGRDELISSLEMRLEAQSLQAERVPAADPEANLPASDAREDPDASDAAPAVEEPEAAAAGAPDDSGSGMSNFLFEDMINDTSWVSEPTEPAHDNEEFGYRPPKKRPAPPADDATCQLSLF